MADETGGMGDAGTGADPSYADQGEGGEWVDPANASGVETFPDPAGGTE